MTAIDDMHKRNDAKEASEAESEVPAGDAEGSSDASNMTKHSHVTGTDSQRSKSQITDPRASQSQFAVTGHPDGDEPLPDTVRYKFDEKKGI
jgi:hypothetical protein